MTMSENVLMDHCFINTLEHPTPTKATANYMRTPSLRLSGVPHTSTMTLFMLIAAAMAMAVEGFSPLSPAQMPAAASTLLSDSRHHPSTEFAVQPLQLSAQSVAEDATGIIQEYPVKIQHQGHSATIFVHNNEPILQALERQSTFSTSCSRKDVDKGEDPSDASSSLALSSIPHECRRGNCLTCSSRIVQSNSQNILANVDSGLSPTVASAFTESGFILTCCSYVTGPGVVLELDQNDIAWDFVYRKYPSDEESKEAALAGQARLLRRTDEQNVEDWKNRMKDTWETNHIDKVDDSFH